MTYKGLQKRTNKAQSQEKEGNNKYETENKQNRDSPKGKKKNHETKNCVFLKR